jgi:hypothetical protein
MIGSLINTWLHNPASLSDESLELTWVSQKAKIMRTSAYESEFLYSSLYTSCENLLTGIVHRHRTFILNGEAKCEFFNYVRDYDGLKMVHSFNLESIPSDVLAGLALWAYRGGRTETSVHDVPQNSGFVIDAISCLINHKQDPVGLFLKGLVLKYGITLYLPPNLGVAHKCLLAAVKS